MLPSAPRADAPRRLADRLAATRHGRFVGRRDELALFRFILHAEEAPCAVLHLHGPGGVGKTSLLREYARLAADHGRPVLSLDGRNVVPSPSGFLTALRHAMGLDPITALPDWPARGVLLLDTYETLAPLDAWLRESFVPQLPDGSLVVTAGRARPAPVWQTDPGWADLTKIVALRNLPPDDSRVYLALRGVSETRHDEALAVTHGHPLALALAADAIDRGDHLTTGTLVGAPDVVRLLLERLVEEAPDQTHQRAIETAMLAWATTESVLAETLDVADAHGLFVWLRALPFMEEGPQGLYPHDLVRELLLADLRWRDPDGHRALIRRLSAHLYGRFQRARGIEQQRIWFDLLHLNRQNPFFRPYFEWSSLGSTYAEPARPADQPAILEMVGRHQGEASTRIARHWLDRQPGAFLVYRGPEGGVYGFMAHPSIHAATADAAAVDPAVATALAFARRHGPMRPGEEVSYLRFWMDRDAHQGVSAAVNLTAINASIHWMTHPRLAWSFIAIADPDFFEPHFASIHFWRSPEADFAVGGRRYGVFAHDWRVEPVTAWMTIKHELASVPAAGPIHPPAPPRPALVVLSETEFAGAVRQALRDYARPDRLATNPLLRSRLVLDAATSDSGPAALQALLREAAAALTATPADLKLHRALWHTFFEPVPSQERAAELLGIPFNTYRYRLAKGIERVTAWLWRRELDGDAP